MASSIPAALKSADIARFVQRSGQVEKAKPAVAYWCNYWVVNQLISRGLHNIDEECTRFTTELMDKLERIKVEHGDDDTITDDVAAQVYVEQFASETFQRAENAMRANKASRQTADTFLAAAVFLELRKIWEPLDLEAASNIKYAKYHALRIAKAIKAGEDPNATNPVVAPDSIQESTQDLDGIGSSQQDTGPGSVTPYQPTVMDISDEHDSPQPYNVADQDQYASRAPFTPTQPNRTAPTPPETAPTMGGIDDYYQQPSAPDVSPLQSPDRGRQGSVGGGYFPRTSENTESDLVTHDQPEGLYPTPSPRLPDTSSLPHPNQFSPSAPPRPAVDSFRSFPPPGIDQNSGASSSTPATPPFSSAPEQAPRYPLPPPSFGVPQPAATPIYQSTTTPYPPPTQQIYGPQAVIDEEALAKAQKHARWAISALNFEDVNTAVKELRGALESLGAR